MTKNIRLSQRPDAMTIAAMIVGAAIVLTLAVPHEVWAAAGSGGAGGGGGTIEGAKNFNKNGMTSVQEVFAVVFVAGAAWGISQATFGGKVGMGLMKAAISCIGFAVVAGPETVMQTVGGWGTDLFKS